ncbi:hypothetical protein MKZ38_010676, partial [Zalerion maritima]
GWCFSISSPSAPRRHGFGERRDGVVGDDGPPREGRGAQGPGLQKGIPGQDVGGEFGGRGRGRRDGGVSIAAGGHEDEEEEEEGWLDLEHLGFELHPGLDSELES